MRPFFTSLIVVLAVVAATVAIADPGHRWTRRLHIAALPVERGQLLVHPADLDERELKVKLLQKKQPDVVLFGSSRVMSVSSSMFDSSEDVLNVGVSGASVEDYAALWQALRANGRLPRTVILYVDPWVFNKHRDQSRWISNRILVSAFMDHVDLDAVTRATITLDAAKARSDEYLDLLSWVSFRTAMSTLRVGATTYEARLTDEAGVTANERGTRWDGSHFYEAKKRQEPSPMEIEQAAKEYALAPTVYSLREFETDLRARRLLDALLNDMKRASVWVLLVKPPYQPTALRLMRERPVTSRALAVYTEQLDDLARTTGIPVCDAIDPSASGCTPTEFMDGMHPLPSCDEKVLKRCLADARSR